MANIKSAKARVITNERDRAKNMQVKNEIKTEIRKAKEAALKKDAGANTAISYAVSRIDSAVSKGVIKKPTGNRKKARLLKYVSKQK